MPAFKDGTRVSYPKGKLRKDGKERLQKYLRVTAGPQRGQYVHDLIAEARLGRKLEGDETVEHRDGNGLNVEPSNLMVVTRAVNTELRHQRQMRERREEAVAMGQGEMRWEGVVEEEAPF